MFVLVCSIFQLPDTFVHSEQLNLVAWSSVTLYFKVTGRVYKVVVVVEDVGEDVVDVDVEEVEEEEVGDVDVVELEDVEEVVVEVVAIVVVGVHLFTVFGLPARRGLLPEGMFIA